MASTNEELCRIKIVAFDSTTILVGQRGTIQVELPECYTGREEYVLTDFHPA